MALGLPALTAFQAGIETTRNTPVAATRRVYRKGALPVEDGPTTDIEAAFPTFAQHIDTVRDNVLVSHSFEGEASYKTAPFWFQADIKGGVTPTGSGPYTWDFPNDSTADDLATMTLEASNNVVAAEVPFLTCQSFELSASDAKGPKPVTYKSNYIGREMTLGITPTAALPEIELAGTHMHFNNARLYVDATPGNIGTTEWSDSLAMFTAKVDNKVTPIFPGGSGGTMRDISRGRRHLELTVDVLMNATTYAEWTAAWKNTTMRYLQLSIPGPGNFAFNIQMACRWAQMAPKVDGDMYRFGLMARSLKDATLGWDFSFQVINDEASV